MKDCRYFVIYKLKNNDYESVVGFHDLSIARDHAKLVATSCGWARIVAGGELWVQDISVRLAPLDEFEGNQS